MFGNICPQCDNRITNFNVRGFVIQEIKGWLDDGGDNGITETISNPTLTEASSFECPECNHIFNFNNIEEAVEWLNSGLESASIPNSRDANMTDILNSLNKEEIDHLEEDLKGINSYERIFEMVKSQRTMCKICNDIYNKIVPYATAKNDNYERMK